MILPANRERFHQGDYNYFIHEKDEDVYKQRTIRNSCLDLISSLIEVFGDQAVESVLLIVESLLTANPVQAPGEDRVGDGVKKLSETMEDINIFENSYTSMNRKHSAKRREVALYLLGSFSEDISMFRIRHPQFELRKLISQALEI